MKKLTILYLASILFMRIGFCSQDPLYTQFMTNPYLINPAITGTYDYYQIILNSRLQWVGLGDQPITNILSLYGPMVKQPMGLGGYVMVDNFQPQSIISFNGTYAYNISVLEDLHVSMGLMVGVLQHKLSNLDLEYDFDPVIQDGMVYQNYKPDASVGVFGWSSMYNFGIAVTNLFGNKLQFEADTNDISSRLKQHYYIHGGYNFYLGRELRLEPQIVLRAVTATLPQVDINARVWYTRRQWNDDYNLWGGLAFRSQESISVLIGALYLKKIEFGYSYDFPVNKMRTLHSGSHEIMLRFRFNDIKEYN